VKLVARGETLTFPRRPLVMGIVNLVADSFSGDGLTDVDAAIALAKQHVAHGADIIDIGAESARTNRAAISEDGETAQLIAFLRRWQEPTWISINTWRPAVAAAALEVGGHILNDIGSLPDDANARICAKNGAALLIMHSVGEPKVPHTHIHYPDIMQRLDEFFSEKLALCASAGLPLDATILDPGIDFAKQQEANLHIYRDLGRLHAFNRPILLPVSRKTVIGDVLNLHNPKDRDAGSVACISAGMRRGAQIFRVHNVAAAAGSIKVLDALAR